MEQIIRKLGVVELEKIEINKETNLPIDWMKWSEVERLQYHYELTEREQVRRTEERKRGLIEKMGEDF